MTDNPKGSRSLVYIMIPQDPPHEFLFTQEGALTALASVADAANAHFIRYYDTVMPMLKSVLYNAHNKAEQLLRAKALECVSLVGMAVGKERFRADAQEVMAFMQQLQVGLTLAACSKSKRQKHTSGRLAGA